MSESMPSLPFLDNCLIGEPLSDHNGIRCCPAMDSQSQEKYILKIISLPSSANFLDAMLLAGAFENEEAAVKYFEQRAKDYIQEIEILQHLSRQEGFLPFDHFSAVPSQEHIGYDIYILNQYRRSLERQFVKKPLTHLDALNLGLDICSALNACRRNGYLYVNVKPSNIFVTENNEYKLCDLGFIRLDSLKYAAITDNCISPYTAPEIQDAYSTINDTLDVYAVGMLLYQIFNGGVLPENKEQPLSPPAYADEELTAIILKACSIQPEQRWRDPAQMGQQIVSYIQKNGAFAAPIVPPAPEPEPEPDLIEENEPETVAETVIPVEIESAAQTESTPVAEEDEAEAEMSAEDDIPQEITTSEEEAAEEPEIQTDTEIETVAEISEEAAVEESEIPAVIPADDMESEIIDAEEALSPQAADEQTAPAAEDMIVQPDEPDRAEQEDAVDISKEECDNGNDDALPIWTLAADEQTPEPAFEPFEDFDDDQTDPAPQQAQEDDLLITEGIIQAEVADASEAPPEFSQENIVIAEQQLKQILEDHDAFTDEAAQIKAAAAYLELDSVDEVPDKEYYGAVSDEVSEILAQADALAATEVPEPVVTPEFSETMFSEDAIASSDSDEIADDPEILDTEEDYIMKSHTNEEKPKRSHLVRNIILILLLLMLLAGGALFYLFFVVQTVDSLEVTGIKDRIVVQVDTEAKEELLTVSCEDIYGKTIVPVNNGTAEFTGLRPDSSYTISVHIAGVHILQGETTETYSTPDETSVISYNVITGNEPGSAILNFTVDGPDSENWNFTYATDGYPEKTESFKGTTLNMKDLLPNKIYTGVLTPETDLFITKPIEITFTASEVIQAKDLKITGCSGGKLTVEWKAPETFTVDSWTVRCYSGKDGASYDQTVTTSKTSHEFKGLNSLESFTVEVTAVGQTIVQKATIGENSVTVTNLTADTSIAGIVNLKWDSGAAPKNGWIISYTVNGAETVMTTTSKEKSVVIDPVVPNANYEFTVQSADSVETFCQSVACVTKATEDFSIDINNKKITAEDLMLSLFKQPTTAQWDFSTLTNSDYVDTFADGDKAGILIYLKKEYEDSAADFNATFVISNDKGEIISISSSETVWNKAWNKNNCIFKIPSMPQEAGYYTVSVYLNSQLADELSFTIK